MNSVLKSPKMSQYEFSFPKLNISTFLCLKIVGKIAHIHNHETFFYFFETLWTCGVQRFGYDLLLNHVQIEFKVFLLMR